MLLADAGLTVKLQIHAEIGVATKLELDEPRELEWKDQSQWSSECRTAAANRVLLR
jgi:hypothetical protein